MVEIATVKPSGPPPVEPTLDSTDDLVVLPREVTSDGTGLYDDSVITTVKELRAMRLQAEFQHDANHREWIGEESLAAGTLALVIAIGGAGGWDGLKALLRRREPKSHVKVRFGRRKITADVDGWEWFEAEGDSGAVADALDHFDSEREATEHPGEGAWPDEPDDSTGTE
jgi:hypothetical protein